MTRERLESIAAEHGLTVLYFKEDEDGEARLSNGVALQSSYRTTEAALRQVLGNCRSVQATAATSSLA